MNFRKAPTIFCESKFVSVLALHMYKAFSPNPPAKYMSKGTCQCFDPICGIMVSYKPKRSFADYLPGTAKYKRPYHPKYL
eukprot:5570515-Ditylum_brightwellii.AAC.1